MTRLAPLPALLLLAACTASASDGPAGAPRVAQDRLAEALAGYSPAGEPVACVNQRDLRGNKSAGEGALIFEASGNRLFVNRPPAGCPELSFNRTLITRTPTGQLCRGDIVRVADLASTVEYGSCGLGDFTPYRRVR